jgi:hypothetical protein
MRHLTLAAVAVVAGVSAFGAPGQAAPGPSLAAAAATVEAGMIHEVQLFPRRYYRNHPYAVPPGAVVVPPPVVVPAPVVPDGAAVVEGAPVVVVPLRPASCGEYHYWNGVACVDARYNNPYIGPR